jgi:hypothetical protein
MSTQSRERSPFQRRRERELEQDGYIATRILRAIRTHITAYKVPP